MPRGLRLGPFSFNLLLPQYTLLANLPLRVLPRHHLSSIRRAANAGKAGGDPHPQSLVGLKRYLRQGYMLRDTLVSPPVLPSLNRFPGPLAGSVVEPPLFRGSWQVPILSDVPTTRRRGRSDV